VGSHGSRRQSGRSSLQACRCASRVATPGIKGVGAAATERLSPLPADSTEQLLARYGTLVALARATP
jgi:hypothetical protein